MIKTISLLVVFALLFTTQAMAATDSPTDPSSNNLLNLTYFPHMGKFEAQSTYTSQFHEVSGASTVSRSQLSVEATYGFLIDGLRISATESTGTVAYAANGGSDYYSGIADPSFNLDYRLIDTTPGGWSADVEFGVSPSFGTNEVADGVVGSNYKGYGDIHLAAAGFWTFGINDAKLSGNITREFSGNAENQGDTQFSYTRSSHWFGDLAFTDRVHLGQTWFVQAAATFNFSTTTDLSYANGTTASSHNPFEVVPQIEIGFLPNKQLLLTASMSYHSYTNEFFPVGFNESDTHQQATQWALSAALEF